MNTVELLRVLPRTNARDGGVYPVDEIPWSWTRPYALIINTDEHTKPGKHWVAVHLDAAGNGTYFDSYGIPPQDPRIVRRLARNSKQFYWNEKRLQSFSSSVCGQYCVVFLWSLCMGNTLHNFIQNFTGDPVRNDRIAVEMFKLITRRRGSNNIVSNGRTERRSHLRGRGIQLSKPRSLNLYF